MTSGSSRELFKALHATLAGSSHLHSLPEDAQQTIHAYLDKHELPDNGDSQKLHDELKNIYTKHVLDDKAKLGLFLHALRLLHPGITGVTRKLEWWDLVLEPTLNAVGHRRDELDYATEFLLGLTEYDANAENATQRARESTALLRRVLGCYVKRSKVKDAQSQALRLEDEYIAQQLETALVACGRRKPKDLIVLLDELIVTKETRLQALGLLGAFARHQPPHLYTVRETALIEHLMKCLLIDTSTTVIQLALTILVMLLPHIPSSVRQHLPTLFVIYTRLLCWDTMVHPSQLSQAQPEDPTGEWPDENGITSTVPLFTLQRQTTPDAGWDKLVSLMPNPEQSPPDLLFFFTFLYGLYPMNFLSYVRKPRKYLKSIDFPRAEEVEFDQVLIRQRTEKFRKMHQLHPNFFTTTLEDELQDDRWLTTDPAEVVAECMGLCIELPNYAAAAAKSQGGGGLTQSHTSTKPEATPEFVKTEDIPPHSLNNDHAEPEPSLLLVAERASGEQAAAERAASPDQKLQATPSAAGPILSRIPSQRSSQTPASGGAPSGTDSPVLPGVESPPFHPTSHQPPAFKPLSTPQSNSHVSVQAGDDHASRQGSIKANPQMSANTALLQREVMMLRNDLNFERYLKQQHLSHIGQLQRRLIKDATHQADLQALMQTNKTLKAKLTKANESYAALKKETATGRINSKRFEAELSSRVRTLREEERAWRVREEDLRVELAKAHTECQHLTRLVVESEARELLSEKRAAAMELENEQTEALKSRVQVLEDKLREYESRDIQFEEASSQVEVLRTELATAHLRLQSKDSGVDRIKSAYEARVLELENQLHDALHPEPGADGSMSPGIQVLIDHAVALANARLLQVKKDHAELKRRHAELEKRCTGLEQQIEEGWMHSAPSPGTPARPRRPDSGGDSGSLHSTGSSSFAGRRHSRDSSQGLLPRRAAPGQAAAAAAVASSSSLYQSETAGGWDSTGSLGLSDRGSVDSGGLPHGEMYQQPGSHFSDDTLAEEQIKERKKKRSAEAKAQGRGSSRFSNFFT